jgi:hypothetical protein
VRGKPALEDIVENEGIPVSHFPRGAIVQELVDCPDHEARRAVLAARVSEVVEDCLAVLNEPFEDTDDDAIHEVALKAAQALGAGHPEAAQALALLASEQYISDNLASYAEATRVVNGFITEDDRWYVVYYNAYLPLFIVPSLYTPWRPTDGTPAPSRSAPSPPTNWTKPPTTRRRPAESSKTCRPSNPPNRARSALAQGKPPTARHGYPSRRPRSGVDGRTGLVSYLLLRHSPTDPQAGTPLRHVFAFSTTRLCVVVANCWNP